MEQMTRKTEKLNSRQESHSAQRIVGTIFGVVEIVLAFRLIFKLLGANPNNIFVKAIYSVTKGFVGIFEGIFSRVATKGVETTAIFEPATLIAMVVVAIIAWVVLRLITPRTGSRFERTIYTEHDNQIK